MNLHKNLHLQKQPTRETSIQFNSKVRKARNKLVSSKMSRIKSPLSSGILIGLMIIPTMASYLSKSTQHLSHYDQDISSSSFGEPVFRLEPASVIQFANTRGVTIPCLASGSPRPTISWYSSSSAGAGAAVEDTTGGRQQRTSVASWFSQADLMSGADSESLEQQSRLVANVTNLRQIVNGGSAIRLLPFKAVDFRPDVHSTEYRCVASNQLATIHSRSVLVQAGK